MYNGRTISSKLIFEKIYRDYRFDFALDYYDMLEWIGEALRHLKIPQYYIDKIATIKIEDGRGKLPCDLFTITQTAAVDTVGCYSQQPIITGLNYADHNTGEVCQLDENGLCPKFNTTEFSECRPSGKLIPMRWNTNSFYKYFHGTNCDWIANSEITYTVNDNYIFTSFQQGEAVMAYKAVPTDEEGFPQIPDNQSTIDYVTLYCATNIARQLWLTDKYTENKYRDIEDRMELFYRKSKAEGSMPASLDEWESYKNQLIRTIPKVYEHNKFFKNLQSPDRVWNHPRLLSTIGTNVNGLV